MSNRLPFAALAVACIMAAAGGGYLATRQNAVPAPVAAQSAPAAQPAPVAAPDTTTSAASPAPSDRPVQETEAVVGDTAKSAAAKPARRSEPPARPSTPSTSASSTARNAGTRTASRNESAPPQLSSTWPSSAAQQSNPAAAPQAVPPAEPAHAEERAQEPPRAPEPPKPTFEELVVSRDSVIGLQIDNRISSETANVEDRVDAHVTRDVKVGDRIAIPAGARVIGAVTQVNRGGKYKEQARLDIRFHTIVLADGTRVPISTDPISRLGAAPGNSSAAKIGGGAAIGAILGAIAGGAKGAGIGAAAGAGAGTAAVQVGDRSNVIFQPGTPVTTRILSPVTVTVEQE